MAPSELVLLSELFLSDSVILEPFMGAHQTMMHVPTPSREKDEGKVIAVQAPKLGSRWRERR
jgi:hypothetical protein